MVFPNFRGLSSKDPAFFFFISSLTDGLQDNETFLHRASCL